MISLWGLELDFLSLFSFLSDCHSTALPGFLLLN